MKKRAFCLLTALICLLCAPAMAAGGASFFRSVQYGPMVSYENYVYGYSMSVYDRFAPLDDEYLASLLQSMDESAAASGEESDEIYDLRIWLSPDSRYEFHVMVKEPTYDSFETEVSMAPQYGDLVRDSYPADSNLRMLHEGILRETAAGTMLETAVAYDQTEDGYTYTTIFMYYDLYSGGAEYCFSLYAYDGDYEAAQAMLAEICDTVTIAPQGYVV